MFWIEIDTYSAEALGYIRRQSPHPISSCETLFGLREFMPYFREQAMDVAIIDTVWNGVWQSMKIAALAEAHEVNVAPHNFYGHLCTGARVTQGERAAYRRPRRRRFPTSVWTGGYRWFRSPNVLCLEKYQHLRAVRHSV